MKFLSGILLCLSVQTFAQNVNTMPVDEFEKNLDSAKVQLLDVRKMEEYQSGHLHGAFQADWLDKKTFEQRVQYLDKAKPVYVYCLSGGRSAAAANWLAQNGFKTVVNMQGGISAWKKENKSVEGTSVVTQMTNDEYDKLIHSSSLVLVDFGAEWCIPCKKMEPVLEQVKKEHSEVRQVRIDAGIQTDIVTKNKVEGLPVFILYKDVKEIWRQEGVIDKKEFDKAIKKSAK
jgi:rhodanese-related sulfurtransferase